MKGETREALREKNLNLKQENQKSSADLEDKSAESDLLSSRSLKHKSFSIKIKKRDNLLKSSLSSEARSKVGNWSR